MQAAEVSALTERGGPAAGESGLGVWIRVGREAAAALGSGGLTYAG